MMNRPKPFRPLSQNKKLIIVRGTTYTSEANKQNKLQNTKLEVGKIMNKQEN